MNTKIKAHIVKEIERVLDEPIRLEHHALDGPEPVHLCSGGDTCPMCQAIGQMIVRAHVYGTSALVAIKHDDLTECLASLRLAVAEVKDMHTHFSREAIYTASVWDFPCDMVEAIVNTLEYPRGEAFVELAISGDEESRQVAYDGLCELTGDFVARETITIMGWDDTNKEER